VALDACPPVNNRLGARVWRGACESTRPVNGCHTARRKPLAAKAVLRGVERQSPTRRERRDTVIDGRRPGLNCHDVGSSCAERSSVRRLARKLRLANDIGRPWPNHSPMLRSITPRVGKVGETPLRMADGSDVFRIDRAVRDLSRGNPKQVVRVAAGGAAPTASSLGVTQAVWAACCSDGAGSHTIARG